MSWRWADVAVGSEPSAHRSVELRTVAGRRAGWLHVWDEGARPTDRALRVDERIVAPGGPATWLSWCRSPDHGDVAFDDAAVTGAIRRCLAGPWPVAVSTALVDWSRLGGALRLGADGRDVDQDPFARLFPQVVLRVAPGSLGRIDPPTGPCITRYGSGNPWPWDQYTGQRP